MLSPDEDAIRMFQRGNSRNQAATRRKLSANSVFQCLISSDRSLSLWTSALVRWTNQQISWGYPLIGGTDTPISWARTRIGWTNTRVASTISKKRASLSSLRGLEYLHEPASRLQ